MFLAITKTVVNGVFGCGVPISVDICGDERATAGGTVVYLTYTYGVMGETITEVDTVMHTFVHRIQVAVEDSIRADGVSQVRVANADIHGIGVIYDACLVQEVWGFISHPHFESGMMPVLGPQPRLCLELERRAETVEKGVDGTSLIVVSLRIQRGINPEIKVELTPLLLPQTVFEVGPKGVCVVDVMRQKVEKLKQDAQIILEKIHLVEDEIEKEAK